MPAGKESSKKRLSAGILLYRFSEGKIQFLLAHPGGPFYAKKDDDHWSIPKGEPDDGEIDLLATAKREFMEETGIEINGSFIELGSIIQKGGKEVFAWAAEGDIPKGHTHVANPVVTEWPPRSGKRIEFPEIDRIEFFYEDDSRRKIKAAQIPFINRLKLILGL